MPRKKQTPRQNAGDGPGNDFGPVPDVRTAPAPDAPAAPPDGSQDFSPQRTRIAAENAALDEYGQLLRHFIRPFPPGAITQDVESEAHALVQRIYANLTLAAWQGMPYSQRLPYLRNALEQTGKIRPAPEAPPTPDKPPAAPIPPESELATIGKEARALALLTEHPEWTDAKIAQNVPCNRTSLYRFEKYRAARELLEQGRMKIPHGSKSKEHGVEAWDDE
jgi:hypothetical protein